MVKGTRSFRQHAAPAPCHGLPQGLEVHVVEQQRVRASFHRLVDLVQVGNLHLNPDPVRYSRPEPLQGLSQGNTLALEHRQVVVLDQHPVAESETVVGSSPDPDRVLLEDA